MATPASNILSVPKPADILTAPFTDTLGVEHSLQSLECLEFPMHPSDPDEFFLLFEDIMVSCLVPVDEWSDWLVSKLGPALFKQLIQLTGNSLSTYEDIRDFICRHWGYDDPLTIYESQVESLRCGSAHELKQLFPRLLKKYARTIERVKRLEPPGVVHDEHLPSRRQIRRWFLASLPAGIAEPMRTFLFNSATAATPVSHYPVSPFTADELCDMAVRYEEHHQRYQNRLARGGGGAESTGAIQRGAAALSAAVVPKNVTWGATDGFIEPGAPRPPDGVGSGINGAGNPHFSNDSKVTIVDSTTPQGRLVDGRLIDSRNFAVDAVPGPLRHSTVQDRATCIKKQQARLPPGTPKRAAIGSTSPCESVNCISGEGGSGCHGNNSRNTTSINRISSSKGKPCSTHRPPKQRLAIPQPNQPAEAVGVGMAASFIVQPNPSSSCVGTARSLIEKARSGSPIVVTPPPLSSRRLWENGNMALQQHHSRLNWWDRSAGPSQTSPGMEIPLKRRRYEAAPSCIREKSSSTRVRTSAEAHHDHDYSGGLGPDQVVVVVPVSEVGVAENGAGTTSTEARRLWKEQAWRLGWKFPHCSMCFELGHRDADCPQVAPLRKVWHTEALKPRSPDVVVVE